MHHRCTIQLGTTSRKIVLVGQDNESPEHLALKLAAYLLFFPMKPILEVSLKNPAISGQEFRPDLLCLNEFGEVRLWGECGTVSTHKLDKLIRRLRESRIVVLKENLREAHNLRRALKKNKIPHPERVEILSFPEDNFRTWMDIMDERIEIFGETAEKEFNLVANAVPFCFNFLSS